MLKNKLFFWDMSLPKAFAAATIGAIIGSCLTFAFFTFIERIFGLC
jgi:hypothetical protein